MKTPLSEGLPPRVRLGRRGVLLAVVLPVLGLLVIAPYAVVARPELCASCHEMKPYVESWRTSTHSAAADDCGDCHAKPGAVGAFVYRMGLYGKAFAILGGAEFVAGEAAAPGLSSCLRSGCHSSNRVTSPSGDLKIGHRVHIEQGDLPCVRCHPGAAHKGVSDRALIPAMKTCKGCHEEEMDYCDFCHTRTMGPQDITAAPLAH